MDNKTYTRNAHSVCCLTYHAVFVIKYRRKVITPEILAFMRSHTDYLISQRYHGKLLEFNGEEDHIHILFELPPSAAPSVIICNLKTQLSKEVRKRFWEQIHNQLWKDSFWSDSYFLSTTGGANLEVLEQYINNKESKNQNENIFIILLQNGCPDGQPFFCFYFFYSILILPQLHEAYW